MYVVSESDWADMNLVAAAGSVDLAAISDERALDAAQRIIEYAPPQLQDDFQLCCAYHIYRTLLIEATNNKDVGQMYAAQSSLLSLIER